jgi:serine/threonine protein kinase
LIGDRQRYRLDKRLGAGGMGDVFLAMDTLLGQQVALKLLKTSLVNSEELRKRFEREVAVCSALKSDHIVHVTDYGVTTEGYPFYVMEYLHGQTLGQLMRREKQLSVERTVGIISQVCEGLHLAHEGVTLWRDGATASEHIKVVHRDLKPDNIFLLPKAQGDWVKILDFGIAKIRKDSSDHTNLTNVFIGTFHYAAPEQFEIEKNLDGRADIYSLGIILYEMLSGTDPFGLGLNIRNIGDMTWALAHTSKQPVPLLEQANCGQMSPELEAVVMRCLQKAPTQRFASVEQLNRALQAAQKTSPPLQTSLRPREESIDVSSETKLIETYNLKPSIPAVGLQGGEDKKKVRRRLPKATVLAGALVIGSLAYYAYIQSQNPSPKLPLPSPTIPNEGKKPARDQQWLAQAQEFAKKNNFKDAIAEASKIQPDSSLSQSAQQLINQYSGNLLKQAESLYIQSYNSKELENAIELTKAIPKTSSVAKNAFEMSTKWRTEWNNNENYLKAAQNALKQQKSQEAIDTANKVRLLGQEVKPNTPYWQNKIKPIIETAQKSIAAPRYNPPPDNPPHYNPPHYNPPRYNPPHYNPPRYNPPRYNPPTYNPPHPPTKQPSWTKKQL